MLAKGAYTKECAELGERDFASLSRAFPAEIEKQYLA